MLYLIVLILSCQLSYAGDLTLLDVPDKKVREATVPKQVSLPQVGSNESSFNSFQEQLHAENEHLKKIKMLSLDLEQVDLELKKREIEVKLSKLNGQGFNQTSSAAVTSELGGNFSMRLMGTYVNANKSLAFMLIDGLPRTVGAGEVLRDGSKVLKVGVNAVEIRKKDGVLTNILLDS